MVLVSIVVSTSFVACHSILECLRMIRDKCSIENALSSPSVRAKLNYQWNSRQHGLPLMKPLRVLQFISISLNNDAYKEHDTYDRRLQSLFLFS